MQVTFHYTAYNESGGKIDSSYNKARRDELSHDGSFSADFPPPATTKKNIDAEHALQRGGAFFSSISNSQGQPAQTRLGINGMIPGFEEALKSMKAGGRRRVIVPPELGPPVGPSTFFSAKQFEVFDVELLVRSNSAPHVPCSKSILG